MVQGAKTVGRDHERVCSRTPNDVCRVEPFAERAQCAARAFNEDNLESHGESVGLGDHLPQSDLSLLFARGEQGRQRGPKVPGVNFIEVEIAILDRVQISGIIASAGTNWLERRDVDTLRAKMSRKQHGEKSFARSSICAGDYDDALHAAMKTGVGATGEFCLKRPAR